LNTCLPNIRQADVGVRKLVLTLLPAQHLFAQHSASRCWRAQACVDVIACSTLRKLVLTV
ncbi:MAG: hypothetical protein KJ622_02015, partial [Alphaproteobacteria bacterium]|nr:hypothetical protein [Alphaproteobacteria bacterium]